MARVSRVLENTLGHLSTTLQQAEQDHARATAGRLDPRAKLVAALVVTVTVVGCRKLSILISLFVCLTTMSFIVGIPWKRLVAAWSGGLFFAAIVAVPAVFTSGWIVAFLLVLRSEASLTCWLLLIMTTPFNLVLRALRGLSVPVVFVAILSMTYRYIFLLVETAQDMLFSRRSRIVGRMDSAESRRLMVSTAGVLLGKSIQMSDDVYQAMTSRGFRGEIHVMDDFRMTSRDWGFVFAIAALACGTWWIGR